MVLDMISAGWLFGIGIVLLFSGRFFKDASIGMLGAILLFIQGVFILIVPISNLNNMMNLGLGAVLFGLGGYILLVAGTETLKANGWWDF